jgi:hypothetical protein
MSDRRRVFLFGLLERPEFNHGIVAGDREFTGDREMFGRLVVGSGAEVSEFFEDKRNSL